MIWRVTLSAIQWDDGKGEYDVRSLPKTLRYIVHSAPTRDAAIEYAMSDASDEYGSLIEGCQSVAERE